MAQTLFHLFLQHLLVVAAMVFLMSVFGECTEGMPTTTYSVLLANSSQESLEGPRVLRSQKQPCSDDKKDYCLHGDCFVYTHPDGKEEFSCTCKPGHSGDRCDHAILETGGCWGSSAEEMIGIILGVTLLLGCVAGAIYCCARKWCRRESLPYQTYKGQEPV
ncbi:epigen-like [Engraulis encrasicolus]|uniref:epigen-like n=1 Tax=Engraulis encrasicolus TaxID=184585 RepID=UPI002FD2B385